MILYDASVRASPLTPVFPFPSMLQPDENLFDPKLPRTIFISGISPSVDKELLLDEFSSMGAIEEVSRHYSFGGQH